MKIEVGKTYRHKITKRKVRVDKIENRRVYFVNRGMPGSGSTTVFDFANKYKEV